MAGSKADRQLLLGIYAAHLGMCAADEVCEAVSTWGGSPDSSLVSEFDVRGLLSGRQIRLVEDLVDERLSHSGDGVWQWCSRHVNTGFIHRLRQTSGDTIRSRLEALCDTVDQPVGMAKLSAGAALDSVAESGVAATIHGSDFPGRYRILRHHAQGGLGKVSVAEDIPLGREVAFKELRRDRVTDVVGRSRFLLEAKVTGRLEHPSIVPVYDVGKQPGGAPFYVMRFVRGKSLREVLAQFYARSQATSSTESTAESTAGSLPAAGLERSVEFRGLLSRFIAVCQAIEYAHNHGVIHRDIKPANIMLGDFGETLVVDWGLAKVIGPSNSDEDLSSPMTGDRGHELTMEGAAVGTPAYMSPEQAGGSDKITPASDIYGLGATLFEIVTGRAPVRDGTLAELLDKVRRGRIEVRQTPGSPGVPAALWAVCRQAMETRPGDRYASAAELARDVERFLADEPVSAMQEPIAVRAKRWIRRHPALVSTGLAVSLVALVSVSVGLWMATGFSQRLERVNGDLTQANRDLERANGELNAANSREKTARAAAEQSLQLAANSVDTFLSQVTNSPELNGPDMSGFRANLLSSAIPYFKQMLLQAPGDAEVEFRRGKALVRLSDIHRELRQMDLALEEVQRAADVMQGVVEQDPANTDYLFHLAVVQNNQGLTLDLAGRPDEANQVFIQTLATRERLLLLLPGDQATRRDHARTLTNLGTIAASQGDFPAAIGFHERAQAIREELLSEAGRNRETLFELANSFTNLSIALAENKQDDEARAAMLSAEALLREESALPEATHESRLALSYALRNLGLHDSARSDFEAALTHHTEAIAVLRELRQRFPESPHIRLELAKALIDVADVRRRRYEFSEGRSAFEEALKHFDELQPAYLEDRAYGEELARCDYTAGMLLSEMQEIGLADQHLEKAIQRIETLSAKLPADAHRRLGLLAKMAMALDARATCQAALDIPGRAEQLFLQSANLSKELADATGDTVKFLGDRADGLHNAAMMMVDQARPKEGQEQYGRALAIREELLKSRPDDKQLLSMQATTYNAVALLFGQLGDDDACRAHYQRCIEICDRLSALDPDHPGYPTTGAGARCNLANLERKLQNVDAALDLYDAAVEKLNLVLERKPQAPDARRFMGITLSGRASLHLEQGRYAKSAADWERGATLTERANAPYYKIHEAYCRAHLGDVERAIEMTAEYAAADPEARFIAAETLCAAAGRTINEPLRDVRLKAAMSYLLDAEEAGYFAKSDGRARLDASMDLDVLRERYDFKELRQRVKRD